MKALDREAAKQQTHKYIHTYIQAGAHTSKQTYIHTTGAHTQKQTYTHIHIYIHTHIHTYINTGRIGHTGNTYIHTTIYRKTTYRQTGSQSVIQAYHICMCANT